MARRAGKASVKDSDVDGAFNRRLVFRKEAFGRLRLSEAQPMDCDRQFVASAFDHDHLCSAVEHLHIVRRDQFLGDARHRIVVAAHNEGTDTYLVKAPQLIGQKPRRLHRGLIAVIEIARKNERVDLLIDADVDNPRKRAPRRIAYEISKLGIAQGK